MNHRKGPRIRTPEYLAQLETLKTKAANRREKFSISCKQIAEATGYTQQAIRLYLSNNLAYGTIGALCLIDKAIDRIIEQTN